MLQSSSKLFNHYQQPLLSSRTIRAPISCSLSRRDLATASLVLAAASQPPLLSALAECSPELQQPPPPTRQVFLDISIDGEAVGRITIGISFSNRAPKGTARFMGLVSGTLGASYRRKEFFKVMPEYVQHGGVRSTSLDNEALKREWEEVDAARAQCPEEFTPGSVALVVRDPSKPSPKPKLVARGGKLKVEEEEVGVEPNGTQFLICTKDIPALHLSSLLVGRVIQGMDVVETISRVPTVQDNTSSPYFRVAKLIGDKRAVVAERGFNRPYSKVLVTNCGFLD